MMARCAFAALFAAGLHASVLHVGPGLKYATPCRAITAAKRGDIIEIDASGNYRGDVCGWTTSNLTILGVNGRPQIDAGGRSAPGTGLWVIAGSDTIVATRDFTGAAVPDHNGAGIRQEGANLTVRNCYFHDNEEGILTGANPSSHIVVENTEFAGNGYQDGQAHNIYVGRVGEFTLRFSYSHFGVSGHLVKSRALRNYILYNRLTGEAGTASYELDLPNGGLSYVIGNVIQQGSTSENETLVAYGEEGLSNPDHRLYFVHNTVVNRNRTGTFLQVNGRSAVVAQNNVFHGPGAVISPAIGDVSHNVVGGAVFVDPDNYNFRLAAGSPGIDSGVQLGIVDGYSLQPEFQYVHPMCFEPRTIAGTAIDAGAFEFGGGGGASSDCARHER